MSKIIDLFKKAKIGDGTLSDLENFLRSQYNLRTTIGSINGSFVLYVTRPLKGHRNEIMHLDIQEEATLMIIDADLNIISKAPPKNYSIESTHCHLKTINHAAPASVTDFVDGRLVTVSKCGNNPVISTKISMYGSNAIKPGSSIETRRVLLECLDNVNPYSGINGLFICRGGIDYSKYCYTFKIASRTETNTGIPSDYELYLIGMYNRQTGTFAGHAEMATFAAKFNLPVTSFDDVDNLIIIRPKESATSYDEIKSIAERRTRSNNIKGVLVTSTADPSVKGHYLVKKNKPAQKQNKVNFNKFLRAVAEPFVENNYVGAMQMRHAHGELAKIIREYMETSKARIMSNFIDARHSRTKLAFHERTKGLPFKKSLTSLYLKKVRYSQEVLKPISTGIFVKELLRDEPYSNKIKPLVLEAVNVKNKNN